MSETTPEDFDLDAWLSGASRPTRSVEVYQRGELLASLDELARKIELAEALGEGERSLSDPSPARLRAKYAELSEEFAAGALTVRVQSSTAEEERKIIASRTATKADLINRDLVHAALVFPKMAREQFDVFVDRIGAHQWEKVRNAYQSACTDEPAPSADFLPHASTPDEG